MQIIGFMVMCIVSATACIFVLSYSVVAAHVNHAQLQRFKSQLESVRSGEPPPRYNTYFRGCNNMPNKVFNFALDDPNEYLSCWTAQVRAFTDATIVLS